MNDAEQNRFIKSIDYTLIGQLYSKIDDIKALTAWSFDENMSLINETTDKEKQDRLKEYFDTGSLKRRDEPTIIPITLRDCLYQYMREQFYNDKMLSTYPEWFI